MYEKAHYDLFIKQNADGKQSLVLRYRLGELNHIEKEIPLNKTKVQLRVKGSSDFYSFEYATDGKNFKSIAKIDARYLSSESSGRIPVFRLRKLENLPEISIYKHTELHRRRAGPETQNRPLIVSKH